MSEELTIAARAVELARGAGATDADAWVQASRESSVRVREGALEQATADATRLLVLRVFVGTQSATVYGADPSPADLARLAADAVELARLAEPDPCAGLPDGPFAAGDDGSLDLHDPDLFALEPPALAELARRTEAAALGHDPRITATDGATVTRNESAFALANSRGFGGTYRTGSCSIEAAVTADDADQKKRMGWWWATARGLGELTTPEEVGRLAAERAIQQLGARKIATREAPVVWSPEMSCALLGIVAEAASGAERYRGASFLIDREGERLASPLVTIVDDATLPRRLGARPFDGEGLPSRRTAVVEEGVFRTFLYDSYAARRSGQASTGSAGRGFHSTYGPWHSVGPSILTLSAGETTPETIIASVDQGLYLTGMFGAGENLITGDFSHGAAGHWIENGKLAYPVDEINIAGHLGEMLANIDAVGTDVTVFDRTAAPTLRMARLTIGGS